MFLFPVVGLYFLERLVRKSMQTLVLGHSRLIHCL